MKRLGSLALLAALPSLALAADADVKAEVGDTVQGARLFAVHCASCHGAEGRGGGSIVPPVPVPVMNDPSRMTLLSDAQVYRLLEGGGEALGRSPTMPAFGDALSDLELWDLVAYLRSRHLGLTDFFPNAESFFGEVYAIDRWGRERHQALTKKKLGEGAATYTVLGVYKGTQGPEGARLIPNDPLEIAKIDRFAKIGYVTFVTAEVPGVKGEQILGISMDKSGLVWKVQCQSDDPRVKARVEKILSVWEGYGRKGQKTPFDPLGRGKVAKNLAKAWTEIYSRAMEAVVMYDKAERERHWADADFGGPADPDVSVEGGELQVDQGKKKKRKRR